MPGSGACRLKPAAFEEGFDAWVPAQERAEQVHGLVAAAAREQGVTKPVPDRTAQPAMGFDPIDRVGVEDFAPDIGVIAGGVTVAAEDVGEVGAAVAGRDRREIDSPTRGPSQRDPLASESIIGFTRGWRVGL